MFVCVRILDEFMCGSQSNAPASGAMESQAAQDYGGSAAEFEVREVDEASYAALLAAANTPQPPSLEAVKAAKLAEKSMSRPQAGNRPGV